MLGSREEWANRRGLRVTFKATVSEHGAHASKVLARAWCHRMQFFYDLEFESAEGPDLEYTLEIIATYIEPSELAALVADCTNPKWVERIEVIRNIPRRVT